MTVVGILVGLTSTWSQGDSGWNGGRPCTQSDSGWNGGWPNTQGDCGWNPDRPGTQGDSGWNPGRPGTGPQSDSGTWYQDRPVSSTLMYN